MFALRVLIVQYLKLIRARNYKIPLNDSLSKTEPTVTTNGKNVNRTALLRKTEKDPRHPTNDDRSGIQTFPGKAEMRFLTHPPPAVTIGPLYYITQGMRNRWTAFLSPDSHFKPAHDAKYRIPAH